MHTIEGNDNDYPGNNFLGTESSLNKYKCLRDSEGDSDADAYAHLIF
uniref:Uncharacterized protein n=1 Tax=Arundo donax TaxID=35708 RepID=A0A0A9GUY8_ARUDO